MKQNKALAFQLVNGLTPLFQHIQMAIQPQGIAGKGGSTRLSMGVGWSDQEVRGETEQEKREKEATENKLKQKAEREKEEKEKQEKEKEKQKQEQEKEKQKREKAKQQREKAKQEKEKQEREEKQRREAEQRQEEAQGTAGNLSDSEIDHPLLNQEYYQDNSSLRDLSDTYSDLVEGDQYTTNTTNTTSTTSTTRSKKSTNNNSSLSSGISSPKLRGTLGNGSYNGPFRGSLDGQPLPDVPLQLEDDIPELNSDKFQEMMGAINPDKKTGGFDYPTM